jgi:7-keto-8-aminopelargonate synthetase-like enzyme
LRPPRGWAPAPGGTRNIAGTNHPLIELERELAELHGKEASLVFTSGYVSNETGISTIAKLLPNCLLLSDALNHNSMIESVRKSGTESRCGVTTTSSISSNCCAQPTPTGRN